MDAPRTVKVSEAVDLALQHHRAGRLAEAESIYRQILAAVPENFDALYLLGMIENQQERREAATSLLQRARLHAPPVAVAHSHLGDAYLALGDLQQARSCYETALGLDPDHPAAHNGLGSTYQNEQRIDEAAVCFRRALSMEPHMAEAHFNLGLCLNANGRRIDAALEFRSAWLHDPSMESAARACLDTVADLARSDPAYRSVAKPAVGEPWDKISVVFCSIDEAKYQTTVALFERVFADRPHELIGIRDARSLAEAYNRGIAASRGDVVLLSHDDIDVFATDFADRLCNHLNRFDVVGVMGATEMSGPAWLWSRRPHLRGWITHRAPEDREWAACIVDPRPVAGEIVVLDGVFVAARRAVFDEVQFDDETFDGFHLYDVDWSYRAAEAGFRLGVAGDLGIVHASRGRFAKDWAEHAARFCVKHSLESLPPPPPPQLLEARFGTLDEVRAFFDRLTDMND